MENHQKVLKAALHPDFELLFEAFMNDPLVKGRITENDGRKLLKEMIKNTEKYLPDGWKA